MFDLSIVLCVRSGDQTCYFMIGKYSLCRSWTRSIENAWHFPSLQEAARWEGALYGLMSSPEAVLYPLPDRQPFPLAKDFRIEYALTCSSPNVLN